MKQFFRRLIANVAEPTVSASIDTLDADPKVILEQGHALEDAGDFQGALRIYDQALDLAPRSPSVHLNRGNALKLFGRLEDASEAFSVSITLNPEFAAGHMNLGNLQLEKAEASNAESSYRKALGIRSQWPEAHFGLGCALQRLGKVQEAEEEFKTVVELKPEHASATVSLARIWVAQRHTVKALSILHSFLAIDPRNPTVNIAVAEIARSIGDSERAVVAYRNALETDANNRRLFSSYLFALNFLPEIGNAEILEEHVRYANCFATEAKSVWPRARFESGKKLRIGYVSPDFRRHSVSCFFEPLLTHHDRNEFEVYCYFNSVDRDHITERFEALSDGWCDIAQMDDSAVAARILGDEIDILVDLSGHTTGDRLGVFARRPAPVQFTWLGYLCTTGLQAMDYRICDRFTDPVDEAENWQVETPARLPDSQWCYQPQVTIPPSSTLPRLENGYWTFGSFNQATKLNPAVIEAWGVALAAIPESRLRIYGVTNELHAARIAQAMAEHGIGVDRLEIVGRIDVDAYFNAYRDVDIALDTFPYNGATTTCDALIMGVPVASVSGERPINRGGLSLLNAVGLGDWVVASAQNLGAMLQSQLDDPSRIAELRSMLPTKMRNSSLMDGARFSREVEALYLEAWRKKCGI